MSTDHFPKTALITGAFGLVGSAAVKSFVDKGYKVVGIDNNQREVFFGKSGSATGLMYYCNNNYIHEYCDIRSRASMDRIIRYYKPAVIIHAAAQPSHDKAAEIPFDDFEINAVGTLNLLEAARRHVKDTVFINIATNKVYGDLASLEYEEQRTRYEYTASGCTGGIDEYVPVDHTMHSLFGVSKLSADLMVQEYGRYFDMNTVSLRAGCLTGPNHAAVESHGFLSYLVKCNLTRTLYTIYGYKGKQVRDNLYSEDLCNLFHEIVKDPGKAEVYNVGGGYGNSCSILEAIEAIVNLSGVAQMIDYQETPRKGDHLVYYTDLTKVQEAYPNWKIKYNLPMIYKELVESWRARLSIEAGAAK